MTSNPAMHPTAHVYEVRPRKDYRGLDLISDALPFGRLLPAMHLLVAKKSGNGSQSK